MKVFMKKIPCILFFLYFIISGCATTKTPVIMGGSNIDGIVDMVYEYTWLEKPKVNWDDANEKASEKCKSWGFQSSFPTGKQKEICREYDQKGTCMRTFTTAYFQCRMSQEQLASSQSYHKKIQEEDKKTEELKQKERSNKFKIEAEKARNSGEYIYHTDDYYKNNVTRQEFQTLCEKVTSINPEVFKDAFRVAAKNKSAVDLIYETGTGVVQFNDVYVNKGKGAPCWANFSINATFKGTSIREDIECPVYNIKKVSKGYKADELFDLVCSSK